MPVQPIESERELKLRERIERELSVGLTGYDVLVQAKKDNIMKLIELVHDHPYITRVEIAKKLGISLRTTSRYLSIIRKILKRYVPVSDLQKRQMNFRVEKAKKILKRQPSISISELATKLDVSPHTVYKYLKLLKKGGK